MESLFSSTVRQQRRAQRSGSVGTVPTASATGARRSGSPHILVPRTRSASPFGVQRRASALPLMLSSSSEDQSALPASSPFALRAAAPSVAAANAAALYLQRNKQIEAHRTALGGRQLVLHHHDDALEHKQQPLYHPRRGGDGRSMMPTTMQQQQGTIGTNNKKYGFHQSDETAEERTNAIAELRRNQIMEENQRAAFANLGAPPSQSKSEGGIGGVWSGANHYPTKNLPLTTSQQGAAPALMAPTTEAVIRMYRQRRAAAGVANRLRSSSSTSSDGGYSSAAPSTRSNSPVVGAGPLSFSSPAPFFAPATAKDAPVASASASGATLSAGGNIGTAAGVGAVQSTRGGIYYPTSTVMYSRNGGGKKRRLANNKGNLVMVSKL